MALLAVFAVMTAVESVVRLVKPVEIAFKQTNFALMAADHFGLIWIAPRMGIVGAITVSRRSFGLPVTTGDVLLDQQVPADIQQKVVDGNQKNGDNRIVDLHLWAVGPDIYAAIVAVATPTPHPPEHYKQMMPRDLKLVHATVEVNRS